VRKLILSASVRVTATGLIRRRHQLLSTVYWRDWTVNESRPWIAPDIAAADSSRDYFAGKDASLEAVLRFPREASFGAVLMNVARAGGSSESVMSLYYRQKTDARFARESTRDALQRLGVYFVSRKSYKEALLAFQLNARDYPDSVADALRQVGEARSRDPQDQSLADLAKKLEGLEGRR
jgi:hypothetical protein